MYWGQAPERSVTSAASGEEQISDVLSCRRDVGELRSGLENGGWPQLSSNCFADLKTSFAACSGGAAPAGGFFAAVACLRKREGDGRSGNIKVLVTSAGRKGGK